jgi:hypothetical protein
VRVHIVLEAGLHPFETTKHGLPVESGGVVVSTKTTQECHICTKMGASLHPIPREIPLLVAETLSVCRRQGPRRRITTQIIRFIMGMIVGYGPRGGQGDGIRWDDAEGEDSCSHLGHGYSRKVERFQGDHLGGCDFERKHTQALDTLVHFSLKEDLLLFPFLTDKMGGGAHRPARS